mmetsp:Transcript_24869/g.58355  ORF Transcript_24869/g.58355 Transcript_24869/m.58355 type:complete len:290 (+) Transcript_24869:148-1017(+)|eukprot:CAMPEP_0197183254 /NCGR_PEP_ID=MMETSP1423-20130617/7717_1 /TAXON_ID=476441 /ORGANISM="Pseudo-nitzschia heimii, Strain UNC1101" /LENGTH=289 /DNA_ID=CAMNT_0042633815 /DNA_START=148 /DNA_END=1017 /DNA_ORIENTATION=+
MSLHNSKLEVLENLDVVSVPSISESSQESHEVVYPATGPTPKEEETKTKKKKNKKKNKNKKKKKKRMSALIDTFKKSFSSAVYSRGESSSSKTSSSSSSGQPESRPQSKQQQFPPEDHIVYAEMQILKVTATKRDLEKFAEELIRAKESVGIDVEVKRIYPSRRHEQRLKEMEEEEKEQHDFLDQLFSDKIPFFHDFLVYGNPEAQFFQMKGKKGELDVFNKICTQVIRGEELKCKVEITDRRELSMPKTIKNNILGGPKSKPDLLDTIFTDDFSGCSPFLHNMILSVY